MTQHTEYLLHEIKCPERNDKAELLSEWRTENGQEILNGIHCNNAQLRDLSGTDCQWSCWKQISRAKP
ncbi:MAG: hypothetical protein ACYSR9_09630 [Planctomycetota bacterium]|jgi:hypothetical protein